MMIQNIASNLDQDTVFQSLIESGGNTGLACELVCKKLDLPLSQIPEIKRQLPHLLSDRIPDLKKQMEAIATLELFSLLPILSKTMQDNLTQLDPNESVNAYMKLMDLISKKTDALMIDVRWNTVPKDVQNLYARLEATGQLNDVIEGEFTQV